MYFTTLHSEDQLVTTRDTLVVNTIIYPRILLTSYLILTKEGMHLSYKCIAEDLRERGR